MTDAEALALIKALTAQLRKVQGEVSRRGFEGRATRGEVVPFSLNGGLLRRGFVARGSTGALSTTGNAASLPQVGVSWKPFPIINPVTGQRGFLIDRTKPFPQYLAGIKRDYLVDPLGLVKEIRLVDL